jgi:hypothetical protein
VLIACAVFATALSQNATWGGLWPPVVSVLRFASLDQRWDMFSPDPARSDGWMRAPGRLADGTVVDLVDDWGRPRPRHPVVLSGPTNEGPRSSDPLYTRWVKVHERLATASYSEYRLEYGRMYCRLRNLHLAPPDSALETFDLLYTERIIQPPGQGPPVTRDHHLWQHQC